MLEQFNSESLAVAIAGLVPGVIIGSAACVWARSAVGRAFQQGSRSRDIEFASLRSSADQATHSLSDLERKLGSATAETQRLERELKAAQIDFARVDEQSTRIPGLEEQLKAGRENADRIREQLHAAREAATALEGQLDNERMNGAEKLKLLSDAKEELSNQFKVLASEILEQKSQKFTEQNQAALLALVNPLKEQLKDFDQHVVNARSEDAKEREKVRSDLKRVFDLGQTMNANTENLTKALKGDSKIQGNWGEIVLESVLERSGLEKGREFVLQETRATEDGKRVRPDAIVLLPENKAIVVDAKVSLTAYERAVNAETDKERDVALSEHAASLRSHILALSGKNYEDLVGTRTLDYVLMFVPIESALSIAMQKDPELFDLAAERRIGLVSPNLLLVSLRIIENLWRSERQNSNALEIARQAGQLYDKFVGFIGAIDALGTRIRQMQDAYDDAHTKLSKGNGNLVARMARLKKHAGKTKKVLPVELVAAASDEWLEDGGEEEPSSREAQPMDKPAQDTGPETLNPETPTSH